MDDEDLSSAGDASEPDVASEDSDTEMPYETAPRTSRVFRDSEKSVVQRLPIKLVDGSIKPMGPNHAVPESESEEEEEEPEAPPVASTSYKREDISTGARFGRASVVDVITKGSRKARIQEAKDQIAGICQDIVAEPEMSVCTHDLASILAHLHVLVGSIEAPARLCFSNGHQSQSSRTNKKRPHDSEVGHLVSTGRFHGYHTGIPDTCSDRSREVGESQSAGDTYS